MPLGRLEPRFVVVWFIATALCAWVYVLRVRRARQEGMFTLLESLPLFVSLLAVALALYAFAGGGHPLAQYNAPDRMRGVAVWALGWLPLLGTSVFCALMSLVRLFMPMRSSYDARFRMASLLASLFTFGAVMKNFPSA